MIFLERFLMPIELPTPVEIPETRPQVLNYIWIRQIVITTPSPLHLDKSVAVAEYGPWSGDPDKDAVWRDDHGNDIAKQIKLDNIYSYAEVLPSVKAALSAMRSAVADMIRYEIERSIQTQEQEIENEVKTEPTIDGT